MDEKKLHEEVKRLFEEIFDNAKPMQELAIKAILEDWEDAEMREEIAKLVENQVIDVRKNYNYYADKFVALATDFAKHHHELAVGVVKDN